MKRKVLFMTLAMAVVLTACGGNADKEASSNTETNVSEDAGAADDGAAEDGAADDDTQTADETQAAADEAGAGAAETEAETESGGDDTAAAAGKYVKGTVTETGWESEFFGLRYTAPEGMGMSTEEELNDLMGLGQEVLSEDFSELQLKYAELTSVYEMMSVGKMDAAQYAKAIEQGLSQVTAINYTLISDDETVKIGGADYLKVSYEAESGGVSMYQDYYIAVVDNRAISLTLTYVDESARDNVLNAFTAY